MKILHLTLTRQWFDEIASGRKTDEYRRKTLYWLARLCEDKSHNFAFKTFDEVHFRNGYNPKSPFMRVEWRGMSETMHEHYGPVFAIHLGKVLEVRR